MFFSEQAVIQTCDKLVTVGAISRQGLTPVVKRADSQVSCYSEPGQLH